MKEHKSSHFQSRHHSYRSNEPKFETARSEHIKQEKISHCVGVAEYMRERAEEYGLDGNVAYTVGLLHDIGYLEGRLGHEQIGSEILSYMQFPQWITDIIACHGSELATVDKEKMSPMLVLLVEADLSIDMYGHRVGFDKRLEDIGKRYGTENNPKFDEVKSNVEFIKAYQQEHDIPSQEETVNRKSTGEVNHESDLMKIFKDFRRKRNEKRKGR